MTTDPQESRDAAVRVRKMVRYDLGDSWYIEIEQDEQDRMKQFAIRRDGSSVTLRGKQMQLALQVLADQEAVTDD